MQDQGSSKWYGANDLLSSASNHDAAGAEFKDWRMPTKRELNKMYSFKNAIGGFVNNSYWSSTEYDYDNAWGQDFSGGHQGHNDKIYAINVRAVRAF
jgi:hypothetical protein